MLKLAPVRSAPLKIVGFETAGQISPLASMKVAFVRLAFVNLAPLRLAPVKLAFVRVAFVKLYQLCKIIEVF